MEPQMNADERRWEDRPAGSAFIRVHPRLVLLGVVLVGCASEKHATTRPASVRERQDAALADPFGYSPNMDENDVSGGKVNELNRGALRKDIDHVLNP